MEPIEVLIGDSERRGTFWGFTVCCDENGLHGIMER
jgi:hypothetical protein